MRRTILTIQDEAERQLRCGCSACAYISPNEIEMIDVLDPGRRPRVKSGNPKDVGSKESMRLCPGIGLEHTFNEDAPGLIREMVFAWGSILEAWEGYAADPELRSAGSSGGVASELGLCGIERGGMHGVLHIASRPDVPYLNHTVLSNTRTKLLLRTGSRYAPASPCDGLRMIEDTRLLGVRVLCLATPRFKSFPLFPSSWSMLDITDKARSFFGTIRRVIRSRMWSPAQQIPHTDRQT